MPFLVFLLTLTTPPEAGTIPSIRQAVLCPAPAAPKPLVKAGLASVKPLAKAGPAAPKPAERAKAGPSAEIRVTDRSGKPLASARVSVAGVSERAGATSASGRLAFWNMMPGVYKLRVDREAYITLEKEFTIKRGLTASVVAALSPAPSAHAGAAGARTVPRVVSSPELAERQLIGRESVKESPIGCAGASDARLLQVREPLMPHAHAEADEMLYVVAGEAALKVGQERAQSVTSGWFSIIPRGTVHSVTRAGKNPVILLSVLGGRPCSAPVLAQAAR